MAWRPSKNKCGGVIYSYDGKGKPGMLNLTIGETVHILEDYQLADNTTAWYRGTSLRKKEEIGIFPSSYIKIKDCLVENEGKYETVTPFQDPTVKEVCYVLHEWCPIWKKLYLDRIVLVFESVGQIMQELVTLCRKLISDTLTQDQAKDIKQKIITRIDWGNRKLGLELVPRIDGEIVEPDTTSVVSLYRVHDQRSKEIDSSIPKEQPATDESRHGHTYHLLFNVKGFACNVGDDSEVNFSLYDANLNSFISERFLARFTRNGMPVDIDKLHNNRALFTNLGFSDLKKDLYLVAHILRRGKMIVSESSRRVPTKITKYKRPYGCSVQSLQDFIQSRDRSQETEFFMKVQSCLENESHFPQLVESLIKKQAQGGRFVSSGIPNLGMVVSFMCLEGELQQVRLENPLLFSRPVALTNKLGFPDVIKPADVRNDLYINIYTGEFEKGSKTSARNVEVTMTVFDADGNQIQDCLVGGSGEPPASEYLSSVFYHNNKPEWNEIVNVSLIIDEFPGAHLRMDFKHCSTRDRGEKKLFAFSYAEITTKGGITMKDGVHQLCVYKCEDPKKLRTVSAYLKLPSTIDDCGNPELMARSPQNPAFQLSRESFTLTSKLCSTKFTQNADLLSVLEWKMHLDVLPSVLEKLQGLDGEQVVRFLQDILDALFDMFGSKSANTSQNSQCLFNSLVYILTLLKLPKFENFIPVLDTYIEEAFSASLLYRDVFACMKDKIKRQMSETGKAGYLVQMFNVLEYLFKILVRSRLLKRQMSVDGEEDFKRQVTTLFDHMGQLLSLATDSLQRAQEALLLHLYKCCEVMEKLLSKKEVCDLLCSLLNKVSKDASGLFLQAKIRLLRDCVTSDLFTITECRRIVLPVCKSQIKKCLIQQLAVHSCTELLGDILHSLFTLSKEKVNIYEDVKTLVIALFDVVMQTALRCEEQLEESQASVVVAPLVSCIIEMLRLMEDSHYSEVLQGYPKGRPMKQFLLRVLTTFQELIKASIFPRDWFVMKMVTNNVILTAVQYFAQALTDHFHNDLDFDYEIWSSYFHLAVAFITQPSLQLEKVSEAKREKVKERYGDMRVLLGFQIQALWQSLGVHKRHFIPSLIGPFLEITMVPETELRKATLPIFYDMMECEHKTKGNFKSVENEMMLKLDHLVTHNNGDREYKNLFESILQEKLRSNMGLKESGTTFIKSITNLLEQLLDYRQVLDGEENRDKRMHCTFNILNFYKADGNRTEMYIRYINKLHNLHVDAENFVEAGFTLLLYADLLPNDWVDDILQAELSYPPQRVWERKEALYKEIIDHFDKGKAWEYSIPLCKELAQLYEKKCYDYRKLSDVLQKQAKCFTNILESPTLRQAPAYYRIAYYGQSFPPFVRNKEFVYRGDECQRLGVLIHQLQTEFPSATIMSSNNTPEDSIKQGDTQYIQICNVKPVPKDRPEFLENTVPPEIQQFYKVNEVDTFQLDIPFHRGEKDKSNEFKTLCIERTILQTAYSLPGILRSFEVVSTRRVSLTPIECAIERMNEVNMELRSLVDKCRIRPNEHFNQLEMRLNGVISAKVNGGIPMFQEAFITPEFPQQHPDEAQHIGTLKATLVEQIHLLGTGLMLHGRIAPPSLQPLHKELEGSFSKLKKGVRESGSPAFVHSMNSSPASSRGPSGTGSVRSLTSTPPSSNRSSTCSGDISLIRFGDDDDIYEKAPEDYERIPNLPQKHRMSFPSLSASQSNISTSHTPPHLAFRPQSVLLAGDSPVNKAELNRNGKFNASDSNLLESCVPPARAQKGLTTSLSSGNIRPITPTSTTTGPLRRQASVPNTNTLEKQSAPPLPERRPNTGTPGRASQALPTTPNGKETTPPPLPSVRKRQSPGIADLGRLSAVQENSSSVALAKTATTTKTATKTATTSPTTPARENSSATTTNRTNSKTAPPLPPKQPSVKPPPTAEKPKLKSSPSLPARTNVTNANTSSATTNPPALPPRRDSQKGSSSEDTKL